jgi:hypothetical protein
MIIRTSPRHYSSVSVKYNIAVVKEITWRRTTGSTGTWLHLGKIHHNIDASVPSHARQCANGLKYSVRYKIQCSNIVRTAHCPVLYRVCLKDLYKFGCEFHVANQYLKFIWTWACKRFLLELQPVRLLHVLAISNDIPVFGSCYCKVARPVHILFDLQTCSYSTITLTGFSPT